MSILQSPMVGEEYKGARAQITKYETRNCYPSRDPLIEEEYRQKLHVILDSSKGDALKSVGKDFTLILYQRCHFCVIRLQS